MKLFFETKLLCYYEIKREIAANHTHMRADIYNDQGPEWCK